MPESIPVHKHSTRIAHEIPPEILLSMYNDYLNQNQTEKALNLKNAYNFKTGKAKLENSLGSTSSYHLPGVGNVVVEGGYWVESGNTKAHIEKLGWVNYSFNNMNLPTAPDAFDNTPPQIGNFMGTTGQNKRMEAFVLPFINYAIDGELQTEALRFSYRAHMQSNGWLPWVMPTKVAGITGQGLRLEAFEITITPAYVNFPCLCMFQTKLYYRAHVQGIGWQSWVSAGQTAGTTGQSKRVEAMQVRVYFVD